jgi:DNA-binding response OmpR family regulator
LTFNTNAILLLVDGEAAARMIKSTNNINRNTPIIAVTAYERILQLAGIFDDTLNKPVTKESVLRCIRQLSDQQQQHHGHSHLWCSTSSTITTPSSFGSSSQQHQIISPLSIAKPSSHHFNPSLNINTSHHQGASQPPLPSSSASSILI